MSKGSNQRKAQVPDGRVAESWQRVYGRRETWFERRDREKAEAATAAPESQIDDRRDARELEDDV